MARNRTLALAIFHLNCKMTDYYRFEQEKLLNLIASPHANVSYDKTGKIAIASGLENLHQWNIRTGTLVKLLKGFLYLTRV